MSDDVLNLSELIGNGDKKETATSTINIENKPKVKIEEAAVKVEVTTSTPTPTPVLQPTIAIVNLHKFLTDNVAKISGFNSVNLTSFTNVDSSRYMLYVSKDEKNADILLYDNVSKYVFTPFVPETIKLVGSGMIITSKECRTYVGKNNVCQYTIKDGSPISVTVFKRIPKPDAKPKYETTSVVETASSMVVDEIKLNIAKCNAALHKEIKDLTTRQEIHDALLKYMANIVDITWLVKMEDLFMTCAL